MRNRAFYILPLVVVALVAVVSPATAQRAAGPYQGVLSPTDDADARHTLIFRASGSGVWDDIAREADESDLDQRFLRSGFAGGASAGLTHARRSSRTQWLSSANTVMRIYGSDGDALATTFKGRSEINSTLNPRVSMSIGGGLTYSPYYDFAPSSSSQFQSVGETGDGFGVATAAERNISADGTLGLNVRLSRRDTLEFGANGGRWEFLDQPESSITSYGGRAGYRHTLTNSLGLHAGFIREEADYEYSGADPVVSNTIDVGLDYGDTLSFSRRTSLSFGFSTSAVRWNDDTHYRVNGSAVLTRGFGRSGSGRLRYSRGTEFTPGFREPLLTNSVGGGFSDQIGLRTSWAADAEYTRGAIGFGSEAEEFDSTDVGGRITRALTRHWGVFGNYTYYRYNVPAGSTVFASLPQFSRHSVSVGISLWSPIINDSRPPRETP